jgi:hypothetical protein
LINLMLLRWLHARFLLGTGTGTGRGTGKGLSRINSSRIIWDAWLSVVGRD